MKKNVQLANAYFVVNYTYGDLYRGDDIKFDYFRTARMAKFPTTKFRKACERARKGYAGNMHADQSHLDFEMHTIHGCADFHKFCKESKFKIDWDEMKLTPCEDIVATVTSRDYRLIVSQYKDHEAFQKVLLKFLEDQKQKARKHNRKEL